MLLLGIFEYGGFEFRTVSRTASLVRPIFAFRRARQSPCVRRLYPAEALATAGTVLVLGRHFFSKMSRHLVSSNIEPIAMVQ